MFFVRSTTDVDEGIERQAMLIEANRPSLTSLTVRLCIGSALSKTQQLNRLSIAFSKNSFITKVDFIDFYTDDLKISWRDVHEVLSNSLSVKELDFERVHDSTSFPNWSSIRSYKPLVKNLLLRNQSRSVKDRLGPFFSELSSVFRFRLFFDILNDNVDVLYFFNNSRSETSLIEMHETKLQALEQQITRVENKAYEILNHLGCDLIVADPNMSIKSIDDAIPLSLQANYAYIRLLGGFAYIDKIKYDFGFLYMHGISLQDFDQKISTLTHSELTVGLSVRLSVNALKLIKKYTFHDFLDSGEARVYRMPSYSELEESLYREPGSRTFYGHYVFLELNKSVVLVTSSGVIVQNQVNEDFYLKHIPGTRLAASADGRRLVVFSDGKTIPVRYASADSSVAIQNAEKRTVQLFRDHIGNPLFTVSFLFKQQLHALKERRDKYVALLQGRAALPIATKDQIVSYIHGTGAQRVVLAKNRFLQNQDKQLRQELLSTHFDDFLAYLTHSGYPYPFSLDAPLLEDEKILYKKDFYEYGCKNDYHTNLSEIPSFPLLIAALAPHYSVLRGFLNQGADPLACVAEKGISILEYASKDLNISIEKRSDLFHSFLSNVREKQCLEQYNKKSQALDQIASYDALLELKNNLDRILLASTRKHDEAYRSIDFPFIYRFVSAFSEIWFQDMVFEKAALYYSCLHRLLALTEEDFDNQLGNFKLIEFFSSPFYNHIDRDIDKIRRSRKNSTRVEKLLRDHDLIINNRLRELVENHERLVGGLG